MIRELWLLVPMGALLVMLAFLIGPRMYPPGEGYAEERRNDRIALALIIAGFALAAVPFGLHLWHERSHQQP